MQRILTVILAAFAGSALGYTAHQFLAMKDEAHAASQQPIVIGAPVATATAATALGLIAGRRGAVVGFVVGLLATTIAGTRLDDMIPGVSDARKKAYSRLQTGSARPAADAPSGSDEA